MITMEWKASFPLDADWSRSERAYSITHVVTGTVGVFIDRDGDVDIRDVRPLEVVTDMGGNESQEVWANITGPLKAWLAVKVDALGLEGMNITDKQAKKALGLVEDWAAHEREHAVGL